MTATMTMTAIATAIRTGDSTMTEEWRADAEEALTVLKEVAPGAVVADPELAPLAPFLPLLGIALRAVTVVAQVRDCPTDEAVHAVASHLTPGMGDSEELVQSGGVPPDGARAAAAAAAATAATSSAEQAAGSAQNALQLLQKP
jgi:hypothetical protein